MCVFTNYEGICQDNLITLRKVVLLRKDIYTEAQSYSGIDSDLVMVRVNGYKQLG